MAPEELIATIFAEYGQQIWLTFVTFVATGFIMIMLKNLILDLNNYFRARMSDIGRGQRIYFQKEIFVIDKIRFRHIEAHDDQKEILIPINKYMADVRIYPKNRYDDFDEKKYFQKPWDGKTDRRKDLEERD